MISQHTIFWFDSSFDSSVLYWIDANITFAITYAYGDISHDHNAVVNVCRVDGGMDRVLVR